MGNILRTSGLSCSVNSTRNYMSRDDFDKVIAAIPKLGIRKWNDKDVEMLFKILYWSGLRFQEGINLKIEAIDINRKELNLGKTKTEKQGVAVIPDVFLDELLTYVLTLDRQDGPLYPGLTYDTAKRWLWKLGKICDIPAWNIRQSESGEKTLSHIFRKSIGKDMLMGTHGKKADIAIIAKQLRHKNTKVTENYLKSSNEAVKEYWAS